MIKYTGYAVAWLIVILAGCINWKVTY